MQPDASNREQHGTSAVNGAVGARRALAVAAWPKPRRTVRPKLPSAAADTIGLSSNASAQPEDAEGQSRLHEGSSLVKSPWKQIHGQEKGGGDVAAEDMPNPNQALNQGHGEHMPVDNALEEEHTQAPSLSQSLERRLQKVVAGDASTEKTSLGLRCTSGKGSFLYYMNKALDKCRRQIARNSGDTQYTGAAAVDPDEDDDVGGPVGVPNEGVGVYLYLDSGELPQETADYWTLIRKAMQDQEMTEEELRRLAELILDKGSRDVTCASKAAGICAVIFGRQQGQDFLYTLLDECRCWYNEREEKLPRATRLVDLHLIHEKGPRVRVWTAFVAFIVHTLVALARRDRSPPDEFTLAPMFHLTLLLCDCLQLMLHSHAVNVKTEMNCFLWALTMAGPIAYKIAPVYLKKVMDSVGDTIGHPQCPDEVRQVLTRVLELRASRWQESEESPEPTTRTTEDVLS
ncbi:uncharacterized protein LOC144097058 isoform X2 [Amblyomma americanum]